jgi:hypothetical protein
MIFHSPDPLPEGLSHFAFRRLSEKQNKVKQLCDLGVSAVRLCLRPLKGNVKPPFLAMVVDLHKKMTCLTLRITARFFKGRPFVIAFCATRNGPVFVDHERV